METCIGFASLKGLKTRWAFSASCGILLLTIHQQNQGWILTLEFCISSLVWNLHKAGHFWQFIIPCNYEYWIGWQWEDYYFLSIIAVKFFSCFCFPVFTNLVLTLPAHCLAKSPQDGAQHFCSPHHLHARLWCMLCCWFSPTASDVLSMSSQCLIYCCCTPTGAEAGFGPYKYLSVLERTLV